MLDVARFGEPQQANPGERILAGAHGVPRSFDDDDDDDDCCDSDLRSCSCQLHTQYSVLSASSIQLGLAAVSCVTHCSLGGLIIHQPRSPVSLLATAVDDTRLRCSASRGHGLCRRGSVKWSDFDVVDIVPESATNSLVDADYSFMIPAS